MSEEFNFEQSFARLEEILGRMNSGKVSLDESMKLYEEADTLIATCGRLLRNAETKIEVLMKKRGEIEVTNGVALTSEFEVKE